MQPHSIERLESRTLLSSVELGSRGILRVVGDDYVDDSITVALTQDGAQVQVIVNGGEPELFAKEDVRHIRVYGKSGNDTILSDDVNGAVPVIVAIDGGEGSDSITAGAERNILYGGAGDDAINAGDGYNVVDGGAGADNLAGGAGRDVINAGPDNDTVHAGDGKDFVRGGGGDDELHGEAGHDYINGGEGNDFITGDAGNDILAGFRGDDTIDGGEDNDRIFGILGNDNLQGGDGDDKIFASEGATVDGGAGENIIRTTDNVFEGRFGLRLGVELRHLIREFRHLR